MPPPHEILTDDYVAELLAKEADDCSLKYSAMGLDALKSNKRPANQPKPNTRFLTNIIRDTNSHNRALLAKENAESRARLRELEEADRRKRDEEERRERRIKPGPGDTRKRMLGDIAAILGGPSKRRRRDDNNNDNTTTSTARDRDEPDPKSDRDRKGKLRELRRRTGDEVEPSSRSRTNDRRSDSRGSHGNSHRREERPRDRRHSSREDRERREDRHRKHKERAARDDDNDNDRRGRHHHYSKKEKAPESTPSINSKDNDSDSDPLDDIIGPAPPSKSIVRRRGRGLIAAMSGIDSRFAADYDPTVDVTPDPDEAGGGGGAADDWDNAVEAFRDRQKWKQQGAERLRSAGFTEDQIRKWEKGDRKDESDVQWNKAGGVREWDRGKVVGMDNTTSSDPEFGRLKGT